MNSRVTRFRKANPVNITNILTGVIRDIHCESDVYFAQLKKQWVSIVGETSARNTTPVKIYDGILTITVSSPVWLTQARFYKSSFIEKINSFDSLKHYEVRDISFTLDKSR